MRQNHPSMPGRHVRFGLLVAGMWALAIAVTLYGPPSVSNAAPPVTLTPTVDRLAAPPTVASPAQADRGAQVYWLNCQPCHGDQGQGLTDEWRAQYPPEDQNCWDSGCHGKNPYDNGFKLPSYVPAVLGPQTLTRFDTAQSLHAFISTRMPFQAPASLTGEEYWQLTAYLLRANGVTWSARELDPTLAAALYLRPPSPAPTSTAPPGLNIQLPDFKFNFGWWLAGGLSASIVIALLMWRRRRR